MSISRDLCQIGKVGNTYEDALSAANFERVD